MSVPIFIGYDSRIAVASDVLTYTIKKHASRPVDINLLKIQDLYAQGLFRRPLDPLQSTEFTYSRFLVPFLRGYNGKALFIDNDMVCFSDIWEILDLPMDDYAIKLVKHVHEPKVTVKMDGKVQSAYPRKNWSSMMLMDCSKLGCWTLDAVETKPAPWLHRFEPIPDEAIGELPAGWNVLDEDYTPGTKLWHMTTGAPYFDKYADMLHAGVWYKAYYDMVHGR